MNYSILFVFALKYICLCILYFQKTHDFVAVKCHLNNQLKLIIFLPENLFKMLETRIDFLISNVAGRLESSLHHIHCFA